MSEITENIGNLNNGINDATDKSENCSLGFNFVKISLNVDSADE